MGHARNEAGLKIDAHWAVIPDAIVAVENAGKDEAVRHRTLADYNKPDKFYATAIRPPPFQRNDFELKHVYDTLLGQYPFHSLPQGNHMECLERFEDLASSIMLNGVTGPDKNDGFHDVRANYNYTQATLVGNSGLMTALVASSRGGGGLDRNGLFSAITPLSLSPDPET